jgi:hypothetical protein
MYCWSPYKNKLDDVLFGGETYIDGCNWLVGEVERKICVTGIVESLSKIIQIFFDELAVNNFLVLIFSHFK